MLTKTEAKKIRSRDYIPKGPLTSIKGVKFRRTTECEIYYCCMHTSTDLQSGPICCGEIAEYIGPKIVDGQVRIIVLCEGHRPHKSNIEENDAQQRKNN